MVEAFITLLPQGKIPIHFPAVSCRYPRRIFVAFHPPLYLKGIDSRPDKLRDHIECTDIFWREQVSPVIGKPARLCASAPVPRTPANHAAHQTLPRITVAQRPMHKGLYLKPALLPDALYFKKSKFPRVYKPRHRVVRKTCHPLRHRKRHLCARVDRKPRKFLRNKFQDPGILHYHGINPLLIVGL